VRFLAALRPGITPTHLRAATALPSPTPTPLQLASPWAPSGALASVVWQDIFGTAPRPLCRADAMAVPAAARARHVLCGVIASTPMRLYRGEETTPRPNTEAPWIAQSDGALSAWHRNVWTVDDLVWFGWSCWRRINAATSSGGFPLRMDRVPPGKWSVDPNTGWVQLDRGDGIHEVVDQATVCLIPGPHEGLLVFAQSSLRHAADIQAAAAQAAKTPAAHIVLQQTAGAPLPKVSDDPNVITIDDLISQWATARRGLNAGVAYLPPNLEAKELGTFAEHLLVEGRNAAAVDIARHASLPADLVDAAGEASLTYSNSRDNDRRTLDYGANLYMGAITGRLSQDDITPMGNRVAFDLEQWLDATVPGQPVAPQQGQQPTQPPAAQPVQPTPQGVAA
jgi:hypothetical protein